MISALLKLCDICEATTRQRSYLHACVVACTIEMLQSAMFNVNHNQRKVIDAIAQCLRTAAMCVIRTTTPILLSTSNDVAFPTHSAGIDPIPHVGERLFEKYTSHTKKWLTVAYLIENPSPILFHARVDMPIIECVRKVLKWHERDVITKLFTSHSENPCARCKTRRTNCELCCTPPSDAHICCCPIPFCWLVYVGVDIWCAVVIVNIAGLYVHQEIGCDLRKYYATFCN